MSALLSFISRTTKTYHNSFPLISVQRCGGGGGGRWRGAGGRGTVNLLFTKLKVFSFIYHTYFYFNEAFSLDWN